MPSWPCFYPVVWAYLWSKNLTPTTKVVVTVIMLVLTAALIFSYTRAAWVSLVGSLGIMAVIMLRVRLWVLALVAVACVGGYFALRRTNHDEARAE